MSAALLAVALALVGNLATNLVEADRPWWRPVVFSTLRLARVFGAIPGAAWRWQPQPVWQKPSWETICRRGQGGIGGASSQVGLGCLMGRHDKAFAGRDIVLRGCS